MLPVFPLEKLKNKRIAILGLGLENAGLLKWLDTKKARLKITICDRRPKNLLPPLKIKNLSISWQTGSAYNKGLERFDILLRSPGWPLRDPALKKARRSGKEITSPLNLFFALSPTKNIIGVTGTKGKGTTATLIYKIIKAAKRRVFLGGNIGIAPFSFFSKIKPTDYIVLELSSFQLEDLKFSPTIAVITNLFNEHLAAADPNNPNYHSTAGAYWQAKLNIARNPGNRDLIVNQKLKKKLSTAKLKGRVSYFQASCLPSRLAGNYNRANIAAAVAVAKLLNIPAAIYRPIIAKFGNLEHRLELVAKKGGVTYYDNSFATTPESSALDLESFSRPVVLIAGGADKGAHFLHFAKLIKTRIKHLILLPGGGTIRLKKELRRLKFPASQTSEVKDMAVAVTSARSQANRGDIILLSTGCASFGLFKNYKERGRLFKKYVRAKK